MPRFVVPVGVLCTDVMCSRALHVCACVMPITAECGYVVSLCFIIYLLFVSFFCNVFFYYFFLFAFFMSRFFMVLCVCCVRTLCARARSYSWYVGGVLVVHSCSWCVGGVLVLW